jgi:hypothetical protein
MSPDHRRVLGIDLNCSESTSPQTEPTAHLPKQIVQAIRIFTRMGSQAEMVQANRDAIEREETPQRTQKFDTDAQCLVIKTQASQ